MMESFPADNPVQGDDTTTAPNPSPGKMLREARERLGLSVADVVEQTKLAQRQVEALEADDFQRLPEMPFVRGFVRSYAKILHLDVEPLLQALPQAKEVSAKLTPASVEVPFPNKHLSQRQNRIWLGAAFLLSLLVASVMWHYTPPPAKPEVAQVETPVSMSAKTPLRPASPVAEAEMAVPLAEKATQSSAETAEPLDTIKPLDIAKPLDTAAKPQVPPVMPQTGTVNPVDQPAAPMRAAVLRLTFDEESWTEIKGKDDKILVSQVNLRGSELRVNGQGPFTLVIGHAASARLYYRGKQIDLAPHTNATSEVARLTLE